MFIQHTKQDLFSLYQEKKKLTVCFTNVCVSQCVGRNFFLLYSNEFILLFRKWKVVVILLYRAFGEYFSFVEIASPPPASAVLLSRLCFIICLLKKLLKSQIINGKVYFFPAQSAVLMIKLIRNLSFASFTSGSISVQDNGHL